MNETYISLSFFTLAPISKKKWQITALYTSLKKRRCSLQFQKNIDFLKVMIGLIRYLVQCVMPTYLTMKNNIYTSDNVHSYLFGFRHIKQDLFVCLFVTEEILYSITAVSDQAPLLQVFLTPRQALSSHPCQ